MEHIYKTKNNTWTWNMFLFGKWKINISMHHILPNMKIWEIGPFIITRRVINE